MCYSIYLLEYTTYHQKRERNAMSRREPCRKFKNTIKNAEECTRRAGCYYNSLRISVKVNTILFVLLFALIVSVWIGSAGFDAALSRISYLGSIATMLILIVFSMRAFDNSKKVMSSIEENLGQLRGSSSIYNFSHSLVELKENVSFVSVITMVGYFLLMYLVGSLFFNKVPMTFSEVGLVPALLMAAIVAPCFVNSYKWVEGEKWLKDSMSKMIDCRAYG